MGISQKIILTQNEGKGHKNSITSYIEERREFHSRLILHDQK